MKTATRQIGQGIVLRVLAPGLLFFLAIATPVAMYMSRPEPLQRSEPDRRPLVETAIVQPAPPTFEIVTSGMVVPKKEVSIAAEVAGKIVRVTDDCQAGRFVSRGALLVEIDPLRYELEVRKLKSELTQIDVDLRQWDVESDNNEILVDIARKDRETALREFQRTDDLFGRNSASESERDASQSSLLRAETALQQLVNNQALFEEKRSRLLAQREMTTTRIAMAQLDVDKTRIVAPMDGYIVEDEVELSSYVQPGTLLCKIEDRSAIEVRCQLKTDDIGWLTKPPVNGGSDGDRPQNSLYQVPRAKATVSYSVGGRTFTWPDAVLSRYEGTGLDQRTRTIPCLVEVPHPEQQHPDDDVPPLLRGTFVTVRLNASSGSGLVTIPNLALRPNDEVWAVRDGRLHIVQAKVARMLEDIVLLRPPTNALAAGDRVVISPLSIAVPGMAVRVADTEGTEKSPLESDQKPIAPAPAARVDAPPPSKSEG